ncbi:MAG: hypothetical protein MZV64_35110 [Ignavibacteriales bacterium]|nr:hypothetical protein [Ignavibacteriales bacterium]
MVHLVNGLLFDLLVEFSVAPVIAHFRVNHVLADGGQFVRQKVVQDLDQFIVAFHVFSFFVLNLKGRHVGTFEPATFQHTNRI